jgi:spore maturation protein CgeB
MGYCPSGRLFEAAACGAPILTDWWEGLDAFFEPGRDILVASDTSQALDALACSDHMRRTLARAARDRTLEQHTAARRVLDLEHALEGTY